MAELKIDLEDNLYKVRTQGFYLEFPGGSAENQKTLIVFLRSFKKDPKAKQGLFTQKQIAQSMTDYKGATKQSIQEQEHQFEQSGKNMRLYLNRKRKVDPQVVQAIEMQLHIDPLKSNRELAIGVNLRLGRKDITEANVDAGLEQIGSKSLRQVLKQQMEKGEVRYKEKYLLERSFEALQSKDSLLKQEALTLLERAEIQPSCEEDGMKVAQVTNSQLESLCTVDEPLTDIPTMLKISVLCLRLYGHGLSLSAVGQCFGADKTTILRWIIGLAIGFYPIISLWIKQRVKGGVLHMDEKWIKIKGKWHYWFVAIDYQTGLPIWQELIPSTSQWHLQWVLMAVKSTPYKVSAIVTDGLKSYIPSIVQVFNGTVIHQLCLFHHQQNVTKFVKKHFTDSQLSQQLKADLKAVFQTNDKRTVKNRLAKLADKAHQLGILDWVNSVTQLLPNLLPAIGSSRIPSTNNSIERFFRSFNQFYKTRNGFFSILSAKRQLILFLVFHLFTQAHNGIAPIETIIPEAKLMPFYKLMNSSFISLDIWQSKQPQSLAFHIPHKAA